MKLHGLEVLVEIIPTWCYWYTSTSL